MHNIFSYDSKFAQVMSFVADLLLMNILFLACCLPIVTIGAAQAGLHTAMRRLENPLDDRSCFKAFFQGFKTGFLRITITHVVLLVLIGITFWTLLVAIDVQDTGLVVHWAVPCVVLVIIMALQALAIAFHSQFECTPINLVRNSLVLLITHPLRSILVAALSWGPVVLYFVNIELFAKMGALFVSVYYSVAFLFCAVLLKKPFKVLMDDASLETEEEKE